jgi:hypothetical protein
MDGIMDGARDFANKFVNQGIEDLDNLKKLSTTVGSRLGEMLQDIQVSSIVGVMLNPRRCVSTNMYLFPT